MSRAVSYRVVVIVGLAAPAMAQDAKAAGDKVYTEQKCRYVIPSPAGATRRGRWTTSVAGCRRMTSALGSRTPKR